MSNIQPEILKKVDFFVKKSIKIDFFVIFQTGTFWVKVWCTVKRNEILISSRCSVDIYCFHTAHISSKNKSTWKFTLSLHSYYITIKTHVNIIYTWIYQPWFLVIMPYLTFHMYANFYLTQLPFPEPVEMVDISRKSKNLIPFNADMEINIYH